MAFVGTELASSHLKIFFSTIFENAPGFICIARRSVEDKQFKEQFFQLPDDLDRIVAYVQRYAPSDNLWYCPHTFHNTKRQKQYVESCPTAWADLDTCHPSMLLVEPSIIIESSPGRYQALWRFDEAIDGLDAESISRRIAYYHEKDGCDRSGWDLTQLLRVPFTYNFKYGGMGIAPQVMVTTAGSETYEPDDFKEYPEVKQFSIAVTTMPSVPQDAAMLFGKWQGRIHSDAYDLFYNEPAEHTWSHALWALEMHLFEAGAPAEDVFWICMGAACNKYARDHRPPEALWKDVCKASIHNQVSQEEVYAPVPENYNEELLTDEQRNAALADHTIVEEYIEWAKTTGDAAHQYHQAGAFVALSAALSGAIRLPTSFGLITPNLWFMVLADTTLTRKTTAMDLAIDVTVDFDKDAILATDGSIEGLFQALSTRPGRPSIFLRDEFSGMLEMMFKRDYYAGMSETLTKLYDGKYQKRVLKREEIEVRDPVLILFAGGIKSRIYGLISHDQVTSGFLPRFILITANADINRIKPVGPPTVQTLSRRDAIVDHLAKLHSHYNDVKTMTINGSAQVIKKQWNAELTPEAWGLYNHLEGKLVKQALLSGYADIMMPSFDRLAKSGLKCAVLIAASRALCDKIVVTELDLWHAFMYVEQWRMYLVEVLSNIGKNDYEKLGDLIVAAVVTEPGIARGTVMRQFHMSAKQADDLLNTLEQRAQVTRVRQGKSERLYPFGYKEIHLP